MQILALVSLVASILFFVLYGAGVFPWTVCAVAVVFCLLLFVQEQRRVRTAPGAAPLGGVQAAYLAVLLFLLFTLVPLPLRATTLTGERRHEQNRRAAAALVDAAKLGLTPQPALWFSITRDRSSTLRITILVIAVFAGGLLAASLPRHWRRGYLRFVVYLGGVIAVAGYVSQWRIPEGFNLWWYLPVPRLDPGPIGCFINPNHFAGYLAVLCPPALVLLLDDVAGRRWIRGLLCAAAFVSMTLATAFSLSRGGVLAYGAR
jgi:hypothetical protein